MRVLAALDFGDSSLEALRQARTLAHSLGGELAACHVLPGSHELVSLLGDGAFGSLADNDKEDASTRLALRDHARAKLGLELNEVFVERGSAYAEIVRRAELWQANFIVVGSHGRTGLARAFLGSVAESVVRYAHCSVLVARPIHAAGVILAATDLSEASMPAIVGGAAAAKRNGARLVVASALTLDNVLPVSAVGMLGALPALPPPEVQRQMRDGLRSTIEQAMASIGAVGEACVLEGSPAAAIVAYADQIRAELVVVGSRGRTGLARLALGSVAEAVVRNASCSVLAVRL
jgi:nucleotide-binding universal stress UspA family protein